MSEMFTKCNGFIVSGDPLVYADSATMTGQGTVSEPFGVKSTDLFVQEPLYTGVSGNSAYIGWRPDETVLWSGADTSATQTLSENITAFEEIKVYGKSHNFFPWISQVWVNSGVVYGIGSQMWWNNPSELDISRYCLSGDKIVPMKGSWYVWAGTATTGDLTGNAAQASYICKVVGINRKV